MVVAGQAGSGKSYLINCLVRAIRSYFNKNKAVQVLAPTGNSANLIWGKTIHNFLKVPCGPRRWKEMSPPVGLTAEKLQSNCEDLQCLIIDERSLVGCNLLGWLEYHLQIGKKSDQLWADLPAIIFLGDDIHLPPVLDCPTYNCTSSCPASVRGAMLWKEFDVVVTLTTWTWTWKRFIGQNSTEELTVIQQSRQCDIQY